MTLNKTLLAVGATMALAAFGTAGAAHERDASTCNTGDLRCTDNAGNFGP